MPRRTTVLASASALIGAMLIWFGQGPAHAADRDCGDFASQKAAQVFFLNNGGPGSDPHALDADGDGIACESNPCPCYYGLTPPSTGGGGGGDTTKPVLRQKARVIRVIDGDTVRVRLAGGPRRDVRLIGIDTPEVFGGTECGGPQASRSMAKLLPRGITVRLVSDPTQAYKDRYERLLRYVSKLSGLDVGRTQLARGWAKVYVFNNNPFQRVTSYRKAQASAQQGPRGIWKVC